MASGHDEWFADESIWEDLYPFTFPEAAFAVADEQVEKILRLTGIGGGKVLDLCCGPGRHAVALAKRGFAGTAVDRTAFLLEHARAAHASLSVEFVLEDMRRFSRPASFDLIINFFTSFGYFDDPADDLRVLELVCENLRPGGVFVLEMVSRERLARAFQATTSRELPNGHVLCCVRDITTFCRGQSAHLSVEGSAAFTSSFARSIIASPKRIRFSSPSGSIAARAFSRRAASSIRWTLGIALLHRGVGRKARPDAKGAGAGCACRRPVG